MEYYVQHLKEMMSPVRQSMSPVRPNMSPVGLKMCPVWQDPIWSKGTGPMEPELVILWNMHMVTILLHGMRKCDWIT
jgi:hypothetical protein